MDKNLLKIKIENLSEKVNDLEGTVLNLSQNNLELKKYINNSTLNKSLYNSHKEKFKKLYLKYLKIESFRKSLVYQKRFLIIILNGYEKKENQEYVEYTFQSQTNRPQFRSFFSKRCIAFKAKNQFKSAVLCVIAVIRMKNICKEKCIGFR